MKFYKISDQSQKETFSEYFDKIYLDTLYDTNFRDNIKADTILIFTKTMKYFKIFDHLRNASKIDLSVSSKLALAFKT